jgi:hypothetical protein
MKKNVVGFFLVMLLICCGRSTGKQDGKKLATTEPAYTVTNSYQPSNAKLLEPVEPLSKMSLLGKWLEVDSNGHQHGEWIFDGSQKRKADYLFLELKDGNIVGDLFYQNQKTKCKLVIVNNIYYIIDQRGAEYKISRTDSNDERTNNGISLALDDIGLGYFQRSEVLEKIETP